ncbi:MAG TPA: restriction endonuclease [Spirochaetaceae bacterium]|nr:restriction endonuclease [Spirochaetaceae bacterium]
MNRIRFIDLFAGIGGIRKGFELAAEELGYFSECVFASEIKPSAISILKQNITVKQRDVVGNIIQEWLRGWSDHNNVEYAVNDNTQMPPDFFLNPNDTESDLLEVKAFNRCAGPGFDIADFRMYEEEITEKPYMLFTDHLIFGYEMTEDGKVLIRDLWLKKVWEIVSSSEDWPLKLQVKANVVHKIRPCMFYSEKSRYKPFEKVEDYISEIEQTVWQNPKTKEESGTWLKRFKESYAKQYGMEMQVPRWQDIEKNYR